MNRVEHRDRAPSRSRTPLLHRPAWLAGLVAAPQAALERAGEVLRAALLREDEVRLRLPARPRLLLRRPRGRLKLKFSTNVAYPKSAADCDLYRCWKRSPIVHPSVSGTPTPRREPRRRSLRRSVARTAPALWVLRTSLRRQYKMKGLSRSLYRLQGYGLLTCNVTP